jgi:hypothetical protein
MPSKGYAKTFFIKRSSLLNDKEKLFCSVDTSTDVFKWSLTWAQCCKTFYGRNLQIFEVS